jgi:type IV secretion system protein VirD4
MTGFGLDDDDDIILREELENDANALQTERDNRDLDAIEKRFNNQFTIHDILTRNGWYPYREHRKNNPRIPYKQYLYSEYQSDKDGERTTTIDIRSNGTEIHIDGGGLKNCKTAFECYQVLEFATDNKYEAYDWEDDLRNHVNFIQGQDLIKLQEICIKYNITFSAHSNQTSPTMSPYQTQYLQYPYPSYTFGSAEWMTFDDCIRQGFFCDTGIPLGQKINENNPLESYYLYYQDERHLITIAPNGTGKNTAVQVPVLLEYPGSMFVIDVKGENAAITARHRKQNLKQDVYILNPFNQLSEHFSDMGHKLGEPNYFKSAGFNPLAKLDHTKDNFVADVNALCEALVETQGNDPYWSDSARDLISCLVMFVCITEKVNSPNRNLVEVRRLLTQGEEDLLKTLLSIAGVQTQESDTEQDAVISEALGDFLPVRQKAHSFIGSSHAIFSVISVARTQTNFLDDPMLAKSLSSNDIDFMRLKTEKVTVYVVLPVKYLFAYSKWFRLLVTSALNDMMSTHEKGDKNVLVMLDECAALGELSCIQTAVGLARGYGIQLWTFWQDMHQLNDTYKTRAASFLANAGVQQHFTPNDMVSAQSISERMGKRTVMKTQHSYNSSGTQSVNFSETGIPLFEDIRLLELGKNEQVLFFVGNRKPLYALKNEYFNHPSYRNKNGQNIYDSNPYYKPKEYDY